MIVAIDGPAAAGKGTLARRLAEYLDLAYLDTGLLYRAVGFQVLEVGADPENAAAAEKAAQSLDSGYFDNPALRTDVVAGAASKVSAVPGVRASLLAFQRSFVADPPEGKKGAVLDGRDIGTVVCPAAAAKLFVTASVEVRTERRLKELRERGEEAIHARVLRDMKERDARDSGRDASPLVPADDALVLDTSDLNADAVFATALDYIQKQTHSG